MTKFFTWETDRGLFNSKDQGIFINKINRELLPPITTPTVKAGKKAGEILQENSLGSREITFDITFFSNNESDHRKEIRELAGALFFEQEGKLTISDELDVFYYAQITGKSDLESVASMGEGSLNFICGDPFAYKKDLTIIENAETTQEIYNDGTAKTYPILTITPTATVSYIRYRNINTQDIMVLLGSFTAGETIIIDHEMNLVYKQATGERIMQTVDLESEFFYLEPSAKNEISFEPAGQLNVKISYRERYI